MNIEDIEYKIMNIEDWNVVDADIRFEKYQ